MSTRVYVDTVRWFVRPNNTDWRYHFELGGIAKHTGQLQFYYPSGLIHALRFNGAYGLGVVRRRFGFPEAEVAISESCLGQLDADELRRSQCDVVFNHGRYPMNAGPTPVLWQNSILDPKMQIARGAPKTIESDEIEAKRIPFEMASAVQVSTDAEKHRLSMYFPKMAEKFFSVPFFLDYLTGEDPAGVAAKHEEPEFRLLFVGREAKRKGLDILLEAMEKLDWSKRRHCSATVVSACSDGDIPMPSWRNLLHLKQASRGDVMKLMRRAHVFAMPSRFESFGLTYIEAMAAGTVAIVPDWEVQREIVDYGNAGCVCPVNADGIARTLEHLLSSKERRRDLAASALARFEGRFTAKVVAQRYEQAFLYCSGRGSGVH